MTINSLYKIPVLWERRIRKQMWATLWKGVSLNRSLRLVKISTKSMRFCLLPFCGLKRPLLMHSVSNSSCLAQMTNLRIGPSWYFRELHGTHFIRTLENKATPMVNDSNIFLPHRVVLCLSYITIIEQIIQFTSYAWIFCIPIVDK